MSDRADDLKATNESIREDAAKVDSLEARKAELPPGDPRVDQISDRVEAVIESMASKAAAEREIAGEIREGD